MEQRTAGWYWDPHEETFNNTLQQEWTHRLPLDPDHQLQLYRLRYWDGHTWTERTLSGTSHERYYVRGVAGLLGAADDTTRFPVVTDRMNKWSYIIWGCLILLLLVVVATLGT